MGDGLLDQLAVLSALPRLDEIVAARRALSRERHDALAGAFADRLPDWRVAPARGGYSLWVRLPDGTGDELAAAAMARGVAVRPAARARPRTSSSTTSACASPRPRRARRGRRATGRRLGGPARTASRTCALARRALACGAA